MVLYEEEAVEEIVTLIFKSNSNIRLFFIPYLSTIFTIKINKSKYSTHIIKKLAINY